MVQYNGCSLQPHKQGGHALADIQQELGALQLMELPFDCHLSVSPAPRAISLSWTFFLLLLISAGNISVAKPSPLVTEVLSSSHGVCGIAVNLI